MAEQNSKNDLPLMQRPAGRPTLEQMRKRLASSRPESAVAPGLPRRPLTAAGRRARKSLTAILAVAALLVASNFLLIAKQANVMSALGFQQVLAPLAPPAALTADEKAVFWATAVFAPDEFRGRYQIPDDALVDPDDARHHLDALVAKGVSPLAQERIQALENPSGGGGS